MDYIFASNVIEGHATVYMSFVTDDNLRGQNVLLLFTVAT